MELFDTGEIPHREFVAGHRSGKYIVHIDYRIANHLTGSGAAGGVHYAATHFWSWVCCLSFPVALLLMIFVKWWVGLIVLVVGLALPAAIKQSSGDFVLTQVLEDEEFYKTAREAGAIHIQITQG